MRIRLTRVTLPRLTAVEVKEKTLAKVFLYLNGIIVDGYFLTRDQGALVVGLLESHTLQSSVHFRPEMRVAEPFVISRRDHVASHI